MPTTSVAIFPLISSASIESFDDPHSEASARMREWSECANRQQGYQESWFGVTEENGSDLCFIITWDSMEAHIESLRRKDYKASTDKISTIFAGAGYMHHVDFEPYANLESAMAAPITEVATFYYDDVPPDDFLERIQRFRETAVEEPGPKPIVIAAGITHEETEYEDVKGNAVVLVAGWESVDAHEEFQSSRLLMQWLGTLQDGVEKMRVHHAAFRKV